MAQGPCLLLLWVFRDLVRQDTKQDRQVVDDPETVVCVSLWIVSYVAVELILLP